jgi:hypothetical protein
MNYSLKIRKNLSLNAHIIQQADDLIRHGGYSDYVDLVESLIRDEWQRRHGPLTADNQPRSTSIAQLNDTDRPPPTR